MVQRVRVRCSCKMFVSGVHAGCHGLQVELRVPRGFADPALDRVAWCVRISQWWYFAMALLGHLTVLGHWTVWVLIRVGAPGPVSHRHCLEYIHRLPPIPLNIPTVILANIPTAIPDVRYPPSFPRRRESSHQPARCGFRDKGFHPVLP